MELYDNPAPARWEELARRCSRDDGAIDAQVRQIVDRVRQEGDAGLRAVVQSIEGSVPRSWTVSPEEFSEAEQAVPQPLQESIREAYSRIYAFHASEKPQEVVWNDGGGVVCRRRFLPISRAGLYIPGGSAPLFSTVLMLGIPAQIAGCPERILCTPPDRDGRIAPALLFAAQLCGIGTVYKIGGAQAIAAMAYGTPAVPKVDKIFGPGNRYVLKAKQMVSYEGIAVDLPAGPSEVMVLADRTARAAFVAADLLSQAEHGPDSQAMLVCGEAAFGAAVQTEIERQKVLRGRRDIIEAALAHSRLIVFRDPADQLAFVNLYAPEHLILAVEDPERTAEQVTAAGSVFLGHYAPESAGDYASGANHTLPTAGCATAWSGLGVESFMHAVTYQQLSPEGLARIGETIVRMAEAEGLDAHAEAVKIRLQP